MGERVRSWLLPAGLVLALLVAWELAARWDILADLFEVRDFLIPSPTAIAEALWEERGLLADDAWVTFQEVVLGFLIAAALGIAFAVVMHLYPAVRRAFYPLLVASQTIPPVAIAPILVVWFGFGIAPKLFLVALICFFPITVNTLDGLRSVDPGLVKMLRTLGADRGQILRRAEFPWAMPYAFSGAKVAITVSVIAAVFAEYVGSSSGLGHLIQVSSGELSTDLTFAAVFVLSVMAICLFGLLSLLERIVVDWREEVR